MEKLTLSLVLGAALGSGFKSVFGSARTELSTLGLEVKKTTQLMGKIGQMASMEAGAEKARQKLQEMRKETERLRLQYTLAAGAGDKAAAGMEQKWARAKQTTLALENALERQRVKISQVGDVLRKAGVNTHDLSGENERLSRTLKDQTDALTKQKKAVEERTAASATMRGEWAKIGAAVGMVSKATGTAIAFESAMADVRKVVTFDSPLQFQQMGKDIQLLAGHLPMTAEGIAAIVTAGGQAGFARDELLKFAESAGKMGIAFDTTADDAGQMMAQWRTSFKIGQTEVIALADKINYLGNTGPANASKISDIVTRIGPLGEVAGLASGEIAALGSTVAGMGIAPEIAATGIKNMILALNSGASATKHQRAAFEALGLDAEQMAKHMQTDAGGAITEVLQKIRQLPKEAQASALKNLFGSESIAAIAPMLTNLEKLQENFGKVGDATKYAGSMEKEYQSRSATTANNIQLLKNNFARLGNIIGTVFLPPLNAVVAGTIWLASKVANLADQFPRLTTVVVGAVTAWLLYKTVVSAATFAMTFIPGASALAASAMAGLGTVMGVVTTIFSATATAARVLWAVLMANPIILIGAAIAGAAYLIYQNWEPIKAFFTGLWAGISSGIGVAVDWIIGKLAMLTAPIKWVMEKSGQIGSALGFGSSAAKPGGAGARNTAAAAVIAGAAAASPMAASAKPVAPVTNHHAITIHAAPGMDEKKLAEHVRRQLDARDREKSAKKRGALYDQE